MNGSIAECNWSPASIHYQNVIEVYQTHNITFSRMWLFLKATLYSRPDFRIPMSTLYISSSNISVPLFSQLGPFACISYRHHHWPTAWWPADQSSFATTRRKVWGFGNLLQFLIPLFQTNLAPVMIAYKADSISTISNPNSFFRMLLTWSQGWLWSSKYAWAEKEAASPTPAAPVESSSSKSEYIMCFSALLLTYEPPFCDCIPDQPKSNART